MLFYNETHFLYFQRETYYALDKYARSNEWGFFSSQKPRRESASQVDEFFDGNISSLIPYRDFNLLFPNMKTEPEENCLNQNTTTAATTIGSPVQQSFSNNPCRVSKSCRDNGLLSSQEDFYSRSVVVPNQELGFADLADAPDFPGLFDNLTPPYQSPTTPCPVKSEPVDSCAFPTNPQEFTSLLDVSLPDQVIVKREPNMDSNSKLLQQQPFSGTSPLSSVSASMQNTFMGHFAMSRLMMPLTPPSSEPGSDSVDSLSVRTTPPPPYGTTSPNNIVRAITDIRENHSVSVYNRRNNPELEKRRTHRCIFPGK